MFLNFVHVFFFFLLLSLFYASKGGGFHLQVNQKEEKACIQGCLICLLIKENYSKSRGNCSNCKLLEREHPGVNILQTSLDVLNYRILIVQEENDIVL